MKHIISAYTALIVFVLNIFMCITLINATASMAEAKEYKAHVIAEIENSNFNQNVINACITQAQAQGYELSVTNCVYDAYNDIQTAEVVLTYSYRLPLFGISQSKTTRGIAR